MLKSKKLLALVLVISISLLATGLTLALFSAAAPTAADSQFTAGKLVIKSERDDGDPIPGPMFYVTAEQGKTTEPILGEYKDGTYPTGLWAPGDNHERTLIVYNRTGDGSTLDAWLNSASATLESGDSSLADKLNVVISTSKPGHPSSEDFVVAQGTLSQFLAGDILLRYDDGTKVPQYLESIRYMHFNVTFDKLSGNEYQDKSLVVKFNVTGEQMIHNP